jgi:hypothetical protein
MGSISFGILYQHKNYIPNKDAVGMLLDLHIQSKFQWKSINHLLLLVGSFVLLVSTLNNHHGQ